MPVASYKVAGELYGPKGLHAPKQASLMAWYRACSKVIKQLPHWTQVQHLIEQAQVDVESIIWELPEGTLFVARKRNLR